MLLNINKSAFIDYY